MNIYSVTKNFAQNEYYAFYDGETEQDVWLSQLAIMVDKPVMIQVFSANSNPNDPPQFKISYNNIIEFGSNIQISKIQFMKPVKAWIAYKKKETV